MLNMGIIGAGDIAHAMAGTVTKMENINMYAIASRSLEKSNAYKEQYNMEKAYGSYEELVNDENVDVVYIATPHSFHYEQAKLCLEHGKHVLCEKAFTINAKQAREIIEIAKEKGLFLGEAMWTRFMPLVKRMKQMINEGAIGHLEGMHANLNFPMLQKERLIKRELAGGALLDVGIYPLTIASVAMGDDIESINVTSILTEDGVDKKGQYSIIYKDGQLADLNSGMSSFSDGNATIYGTDGMMILEGVNCPRGLKVFDNQWNLVGDYKPEGMITGYEYEVEAMIKAIENKKTCCDEIDHNQTIKMMELMDKIRHKMGVIYPGE